MGVNIRRIKAYRVYNDLGQLDMANKIGISHTSYCHKEQGLKEFTSSEVGKMAEVFNVEPGDLYSRESKLQLL